MAELSLFAAFYILAQGIERFLEFFTEKPPFINDKLVIDASERKIKVWQNIIDKLIEKDPSDPNLQNNIAQYQQNIEAEESKISGKKSTRIVGLWGLASLLGIYLCWVFKIGFLQTIGATIPSGLGELDYIVSGIIVGSGTKPLHDIVAKIEKATKK